MGKNLFVIVLIIMSSFTSIHTIWWPSFQFNTTTFGIAIDSRFHWHNSNSIHTQSNQQYILEIINTVAILDTEIEKAGDGTATTCGARTSAMSSSIYIHSLQLNQNRPIQTQHIAVITTRAAIGGCAWYHTSSTRYLTFHFIFRTNGRCFRFRCWSTSV